MPIIPLPGISPPDFASRHAAEWVHIRTEKLCYQSQLLPLLRMSRVVYATRWVFATVPFSPNTPQAGCMERAKSCATYSLLSEVLSTLGAFLARSVFHFKCGTLFWSALPALIQPRGGNVGMRCGVSRNPPFWEPLQALIPSGNMVWHTKFRLSYRAADGHNKTSGIMR